MVMLTFVFVMYVHTDHHSTILSLTQTCQVLMHKPRGEAHPGTGRQPLIDRLLDTAVPEVTARRARPGMAIVAKGYLTILSQLLWSAASRQAMFKYLTPEMVFRMAIQLVDWFDHAGTKLRRKVWASALCACLQHPSATTDKLMAMVVEVFVSVVTELSEDAKNARSRCGVRGRLGRKVRSRVTGPLTLTIKLDTTLSFCTHDVCYTCLASLYLSIYLTYTGMPSSHPTPPHRYHHPHSHSNLFTSSPPLHPRAPAPVTIMTKLVYLWRVRYLTEMWYDV